MDKTANTGCGRDLTNQPAWTTCGPGSRPIVNNDIMPGWRCGIDKHIYNLPWYCKACAVRLGLTW